jgi:hypothetical protein
MNSLDMADYNQMKSSVILSGAKDLIAFGTVINDRSGVTRSFAPLRIKNGKD